MNTGIFKNLVLFGCVATVFGLSLQAKEIDQFSDRIFQLKNLTDSSAEIDREVNRKLKEIETRLNKTANLTDKKRDAILHSVFQGNVLGEFKTPFEYWLRDEANISLYWVSHRGIYGHAVDYDDMGLAWYVEIAPILRLGSHLIGIDKFGHFFGQGWYYYGTYERLKMKNPDWKEPKLHQEVLKYGHSLEMSYLGLGGSGIYSFADLAANYQGYRFFRSLFKGRRAYFRKIGDRYKLARRFSSRSYVSDDWDEVINPSMTRTEKLYGKISKFMQKKICPEFLSNSVEFLNKTGKKLSKEKYIWNGPHPNLKRLDLFEICLK